MDNGSFDNKDFALEVQNPKLQSAAKSQNPLVFNVDCNGIDFETYQFLLSDLAQGLEDANRMYGFGEAGYIGTDGNYHPLTDNFIPELESKPKRRPTPKPKRFRYRAKSKTTLSPQIHYLLRWRVE
jgi:hypothetical protein